jgi:sec-independent protein translocase protein TatB
VFDLGWQEFAVIAIVLVVVIGPKDMPRVLRTVSRFVNKARGMAREFQTSMMAVADEEEFRDVKQALRDAKAGKVDALADFAEIREAATDTADEMKSAATMDSDDGNNIMSTAVMRKKTARKTSPKKSKS